MGASDDHKRVADRATRLLKRLHGCFIGAVEFSGGWSGEHVDGIVFNGMASLMVEAKVSRSDFLADAKKDFRQNPANGVGKYRFYACPPDLISVDELPEKWGLIYVPEKGKCTMPRGYGGEIKTGEEQHPDRPWKRDTYDVYGCNLLHRWDSPGHPAKRDAFEYCPDKERSFLLYLAKRYKQQKFMDNLL